MPPSKPIALLFVLAVAAVLAGCGGDGESTTSEKTGTTNAAAAKTKPPATPDKGEESAKKKAEGKQDAQKPKRSAEAVARELERKLANSGQPIPADSPVARKILESLDKSPGNKKGENSTDSVSKALDEVLSGGNGNSGKGGGSGDSPAAGVEEILEQIQK